MIGETKAATDGAGSAEWRAAADCRVPRVDELGWQECGTWTGVPGGQAGGAPPISWTDTGHHTALQQRARHQRFCSIISVFHMGPKIERKPGNSKAGWKMVRLFCC